MLKEFFSIRLNSLYGSGEFKDDRALREEFFLGQFVSECIQLTCTDSHGWRNQRVGRDSAELSSPFENNIQANEKTIPKLANTGSHHAAHEPIVADACKIQALQVWHTKSRPPVVRMSVSIASGKAGAPCEFRLLIKFSEKSVWGHKNVPPFEVASPKSHQWDHLSLFHMSLEPCLHTL